MGIIQITYYPYLLPNTTTFSLSEPEIMEQKLNDYLLKSTTSSPSSLSDEMASSLHHKGSVARLEDGVMDNTIDKLSVSSDARPNDTSSNANLKAVWDNLMKDFELTGKAHRDAAVLMISWAKEFDDLHTKSEVDKLASVFTNLFSYKVEKLQLEASRNGTYTPYLQISRSLLDFVCKFNHDSTLLIIYYAGHGIPGKPGELHLAGNRQPDKELDDSNSVAWHDAEHILKNARPDALLIFDCCYAGNLLPCDMCARYPTRSFEYIAACGIDKETNRPGEKSFTAALIWSLQRLVEEERKSFTTQELQMMIMRAPEFPQKQFVPLLKQDELRQQGIILSPVSTDCKTISPELPTSSLTSNELPQNYLDLRFWYLSPLDENNIENIATQLRRLMKDKTINASRIGWLGLKKK